MKQVVYGKQHQRNVVKKHLIFLSVVNLAVGSCLYLCCTLLFPLPLYCYVLFIGIYFMIVFALIQFREQKSYVVFDEVGIHIYTYCYWIYWEILRRKEPDVIHYKYQDIACSLSYCEAPKRSTQQYCLRIHIMKDTTKDSIEIQTNAVSKSHLNWILLLLSSSTKEYCDRDHLQLCLLHHKDAFDYYIERIKEEHNENR